MSDPVARRESTSVRWRYDQFRRDEIEFYKQVVSHRTVMQLAELARQRMHARGELLLGDLTLASEVDALVGERMRLPSFRAWSRQQCRIAGVRRAWSERAQQLALHLLPADVSGDVLVLQPRSADVWEAVCGSGRRVVVVEPDREEREQVIDRACRGGWSDAVTTAASPDAVDSGAVFTSVVYSPAACADLAEWEAEAMIESLKARTAAGGVHVVDGLLGDRIAAPRSVLRRSYASWTRRVQRGAQEWTLVATRA